MGNIMILTKNEIISATSSGFARKFSVARDGRIQLNRLRFRNFNHPRRSRPQGNCWRTM